MKHRFTKTVITAGFAMFSMFFGSGNLVFPLGIGTQALDSSPMAMLGLLITGVIVPFLGLLGVILFAGNRANYFASIGKVPAFLLTFFMLALMGPVGVIPRCIIVAYGGIALFIPSLSFELFAVIFCVATLFIVWNHDRVIPILGRILTPWLLVSVFAIIIAGLFFSDIITPVSEHDGKAAFMIGLTEGYQTMDLLAAFFFSATTVAYLRAHLRSDDRPNTLLRLSLTSSLIGAGLLGFIYICFVALGGKYAHALLNVKPEQMLAKIAGLSLGPLAVPAASISIALACLTTATILTMLFSDFLNEDMCRKKLGNHKAIIITLVISAIVSRVGFGPLKIWIATILQVAYPALIVYTIANIIHKIWHVNFSRWAFWITAFASMAYYVIY